MYRLIAAGGAFAAATALAHYLLPEGWTYLAAGAFILLMLPAALLLRDIRRSHALIACAFAALGFGWYGLYTHIFMEPAAAYADTTARVAVRVTENVYRDGDYASVRVRMAERGKPGFHISVMDYSGTMPELRAGDRVELELEFTDSLERYGEATDIYAARGDQLRAYFVSAGEPERDALSALYFPQELMRIMQDSIRRCFPEDVRDFMLALLTGETSGVYEDHELDNALSVTGLAHVISVSGMHLAFLYSAVSTLVGKRRAALFGAPLIVIFTFMAGCSAAIVRACVMLLLNMAAPLLKRESDGLTSLAFSLLILLAANPLSIASTSLQLSFGSMLGLILLSPWLYERLSARFAKRGMKFMRLRKLIITAVSSSLGATVFTAPTVAAVFGYVSLISPVANLLTLWAASAAFTVGFAAAALGALIPALGAAAAWAAAWPARYFSFVTIQLARLPFAAVYTANGFIVLWLAATYAFFIMAALFSRKEGRLRFASPLACSVLLLAAALISARMDIAREKSITVLDVGQGQSVVFLAGENAAVVDCGGINSWDDAGDKASGFLHGRGRSSLDALILTHLHSDHADGAAALLSSVDVETLYMPAGVDDADGELAEILDAAEARGTEVVEISEDTTLELGELSMTLLAPVGAGDENERGLVICADICGYGAVITGDASAAVERALVSEGKLPQSELLVAGHHGSRYSNSLELLDAVQPETVCVSVGYNWYGHPTEDALARFAIAGAEVYRSDLNDNITVRIDSNG